MTGNGRARERLLQSRVSRSGAMPEPTVIVRMKEDVRYHVLSYACLRAGLRERAFPLALMRFSPTYREERFKC
jgi:hypothetical protein